jgi:hypothetical protein
MTDSTRDIVTAIRTRLLDFSPTGGGADLGTLLGDRLYYGQAPAAGSVAPLFPYGVYRLTNRLETDGFAGMRETGDVEVLLFGRPRSTQWDVEACADLADQALLAWHHTTTGLHFSRFRTRDTLPPAPDPMDREVVLIRLLFPVVLWPTYRTQYA